jgi:hypothetical protein
MPTRGSRDTASEMITRHHDPAIRHSEFQRSTVQKIGTIYCCGHKATKRRARPDGTVRRGKRDLHQGVLNG